MNKSQDTPNTSTCVRLVEARKYRIPAVYRLVFILALLIGIAGLGVLKSSTVNAGGTVSCLGSAAGLVGSEFTPSSGSAGSSDPNNQGYWNDPNFTYRSYRFWVQGTQGNGNWPSSSETAINGGVGSVPAVYMSNQTCTSGFGSYNNSISNFTDSKGYAPIAARLGIPGAWGGQVNYTSDDIPSADAATIPNPPRGSNHNSQAAFVDDAAIAKINGTTIMCINMTGCQSPNDDLENYYPDPTHNDGTMGSNSGTLTDYCSLTDGPCSKPDGTDELPNGAGYFYTLDNTSGNAANNKWFSPDGVNAYGGTMEAGGDYTDLTSLIGATNNFNGNQPNTLNNFTLDLEAKSSYQPNIAAWVIITFKYPKTLSTPGAITLTPECSDSSAFGIPDVEVSVPSSFATPIYIGYSIDGASPQDNLLTNGGNGQYQIDMRSYFSPPWPTSGGSASAHTVTVWVDSAGGQTYGPTSSSNGLNSVTWGPYTYPCGSGGGGPPPSACYQQQGQATAPATQPGSVSWTDYVWTQIAPAVPPTLDSNGNPIPGTGSPAQYAYEPSGQTASVTENFQSMNVNYQFDDGTNGSVPLSPSSSSNPATYQAGNYTGFQTVNFSGTAQYSVTVPESQTYSGGGPSDGSTTIYLTSASSAPVTTNPSSMPPCVQGTYCDQATVPAVEGLGRNFAGVSLPESYTVGSNGSEPYGPDGDAYVVSYSGGSLTITDGTGNQLPSGSELAYSTPLAPSGDPVFSTGTLVWYPHMYATSVGSFYNFSYHLTMPSNADTTANMASNCGTSNMTISSQPYFQVTQGDVVTGSGISGSNGSACTQNPGANIYSWNTNDQSLDSQNWNGSAGGQFRVQALGNIDGFASAQNSPPGAPVGLSFSNTMYNSYSSGNSSSGKFGGQFGSAPCIPNYNGLNTPNSRLYPGSIAGMSTGTYYNNGSIYPLSGGIIPIGTQVTLYVNGDVYINGNISPSGGTVTDPTKVPSFTLIDTSGNIYIDPGVTNLYGSYIDQSGTIYDCSYGTASFPGGNTCSNQLTVNGDLTAKTVKLWRTYATMGTDGGVNHAPAESIQYTPYIWLAPPSSPAHNGYDAITSLPPVL